MIINDIVNECHQRYTNREECNECDNQLFCQNCGYCLNEIHFNETERTYNCHNMIYFYTCRFLYKYASEIKKLFNESNYFSFLNYYNIISIGCGPCTDLFGYYNHEDNKIINYVGIDMNEIWKPIHTIIDSNNNDSNLNVRFIYRDIFKIVDRLNINRTNWKPNILSFQYVFSDMKKYKTDEYIFNFIDDVIDKIVVHMPDKSLIIINDINHRNVRKFLSHFNKIKIRYPSSEYQNYNFLNECRNYTPTYGNRYQCNRLLFNIPDHIKTYYCTNNNSNNTCSSSQKILLLRK